MSMVVLVSLLAAIRSPADSNMVRVEGGTFLMQDPRLGGTFSVSREVTISTFYVSRYEVTQRDFEALMGFNPSYFEGPDLPVEQVDWYEAVEFANRKSVAEGLQPAYRIFKDRRDPGNTAPDDPKKWTVEWVQGANGYRLPTEAEWEFAARGGRMSRGYRYAGSDDFRLVGVSSLEGKTLPVGSKEPNELGLYDMSGNVWEWWDWYTTDSRELSAVDPRGAATSSARALRSGSWFNAQNWLRVTARFSYPPNNRLSRRGFRLVRSG